MHPEQLDDGGGTLLSGEIPAAGAAMVVVRREGGDRAARRMRSATAPRVRLLNPRAGAREGGAGAVTVRWRANDADGDRLVATVQYSANRGRNWRTVHLGGSTGGLRLAGRELAPSRRAQVRVRVDDGFDEAVATSRVFTVLAAAPQARILEPVRGARVREGAPVILRAEASAAGRPLAGRALRWFDRRRALGTGQTLTLPRLDAGRRTIRLVATAGGRRTVRTVAISVAGVRPAFLVLSGPLRLSPRAHNARLRVATTATATLSAGGRRFPVGPRARTLTIPIRPANRPLRLALELRGAGGRTRTTLTIPRR
jgi:hypothetical protein